MTITPTEQVSAEIRAQMARRRIRQEQLAELLDVSQAAVSNRLRGAVAWDIDELVLVAEFLSVPLTDLLPDDDKAAAS